MGAERAEAAVFPLSADVVLRGPPQGYWTHAAWERLPDDGNRYEVIAGVLYMSTAPSTFHQWIVGALVRYVGIPAHEQGLAWWFMGPVGLLLPGGTATQPDFLIVTRANMDIIRQRRIRGVPDLVAEVLSPGNAAYDETTKLDSYALEGVTEYVIINPMARTLRHFRLKAPGSYGEPQTLREGEAVMFDCLPGVVLPVEKLFADAPDTEL